MHISSLLKDGNPLISFEFFPPKDDEGAEKLFSEIFHLKDLNPAYVSVTYGAGGGTRERTHNLVKRVISETGIPTTPHLTCVNHSRKEIRNILEGYDLLGASNILALRGDAPKSVDYQPRNDDFPHAVNLIDFIKNFSTSQVGTPFGIGIAAFPEGHPETPNRLREMDFLKAKVDAGADYICTQLFFDNHDFFDFRERCELAGINIPIMPGVMPITTVSGMVRMADLASGARYPAKLQRRIRAVESSPEQVLEEGISYATEQCQELIDEGVPGIHFFTLNKSAPTVAIVKSLTI